MEKKQNSGALFKNDKKTDEKHPDYRGTAIVGGIDYWVSAWVNTGKESGKKYFALKYTPKDEQAQPRQPQPQQQVVLDESELPF